jgi:hypothetical protein
MNDLRHQLDELLRRFPAVIERRQIDEWSRRFRSALRSVNPLTWPKRVAGAIRLVPVWVWLLLASTQVLNIAASAYQLSNPHEPTWLRDFPASTPKDRALVKEIYEEHVARYEQSEGNSGLPSSGRLSWALFSWC